MAPDLPTHHPANLTHLRWIPLGVFLLGLALTALLWQSLRAHDRDRVLAQVPGWHSEQHLDLADGISHRLGNLRLLGDALILGNNDPTLFDSLSQPLLRRYPDLQQLIWASHLDAPANSTGTNGTGQSPAETIPADQLRVIHHASRTDLNSKSLQGSDLLTMLVWASALRKALEGDEPTATPVTDENDGKSTPQIQVILPLKANAQGQRSVLVASFNPRQLIGDILQPRLPLGITAEVFDLDQHRRDPLFSSSELRQGKAQAMGKALDATLALADRRWLLRTTPNDNLQAVSKSQLARALMVAGIALSLLLAGLAQRLVKAWQEIHAQHDQLQQLLDRDRRYLQNKQIEKQVLGQALADSEQRTRDFIELHDSFSCELDEDGKIGFISPHIHAILDFAPSSLTQRPLADLLPAEEHPRLAAALESCRRERCTVRLDTRFLDAHGHETPATLRLLTVSNPVSDCRGFRAVGWLR